MLTAGSCLLSTWRVDPKCTAEWHSGFTCMTEHSDGKPNYEALLLILIAYPDRGSTQLTGRRIEHRSVFTPSQRSPRQFRRGNFAFIARMRLTRADRDQDSHAVMPLISLLTSQLKLSPYSTPYGNLYAFFWQHTESKVVPVKLKLWNEELRSLFSCCNLFMPLSITRGLAKLPWMEEYDTALDYWLHRRVSTCYNTFYDTMGCLLRDNSASHSDSIN